jgi:predicted ribosomally synthesized peptide with SipW-like signal peptide
MISAKEVSPESKNRTAKAPKIRAVLAGGLVLGIGAAVTLAAWNDSEFAQGTFTAGTFNLEGSTDGAAFAEHATSSAAATLDFSVTPDNLAPGDTVDTPFAVRLDAASTRDATVTLSTEGSTGALAGLTYSLTQSDDFGCGEPVTSTPVSGHALGTTPGNVTFALDQGTGPGAGAPVNLCFRITANDALEQSETGTTTWEFAAESQ